QARQAQRREGLQTRQSAGNRVAGRDDFRSGGRGIRGHRRVQRREASFSTYYARSRRLLLQGRLLDGPQSLGGSPETVRRTGGPSRVGGEKSTQLRAGVEGLR